MKTLLIKIANSLDQTNIYLFKLAIQTLENDVKDAQI